MHYDNEIKKIHDIGIQVAIVIRGGNIYRGFNNTEHKIDRVQGDYMGMLATIINGLALQNTLENIEVPTRLQSAINVNQVAEPYIKRKAIRHLEKNRIVIFSAGTGNPYFTTDSAAVLRAIEIEANVILKGTIFTKYKQFVQNCFKICDRQALHAKSLGFVHPTIKKEMFFDSELAEDMEQLIEKWRKYATHQSL